MILNLNVLSMPTRKRNQFEAKGILTIEDLLRYVPTKYHDFTTPTYIDEVENNDMCAIIAKIEKIEDKKTFIKATVKDGKGSSFSIMWFHAPYVKRMIKVGRVYIFCGKVSEFEPFPGRVYKSIISPLFSEDFSKYQKIFPVYRKIKGMSDDYLKEKIFEALACNSKEEYLELDIVNNFDLMKNYEMERAIHYPKTMEEAEKAKNRIIFDELFKFALIMNERFTTSGKITNIEISKRGLLDNFIAGLPFSLTKDQSKVIDNLFEHLLSKEKTMALVQGDVGCGKTMVAIALMLIMAENGYQSCLMAPTTVLATQHYEEVKELCEGFEGIEVVFLNGAMRVKEKREALAKITSGEATIIIGTHAVLSKDVHFKNLGIAIVDEEHRFGVVQRHLFEEKNEDIHIVTMSATPIPRSLAMTIYGDGSQIYTIKTMPKGRIPVETMVTDSEKESYDLMLREIEKGRQCYVVCPLIEDSDSDVLKGVDSVEKTYARLRKYFKENKNVSIGKITGKMKKKEVEEEINHFLNNDYNIIVSTTIIEVGVNIPNSTVMLIKNAERFGIAQLHQLRGRVGRGSFQSYCLLLTDKVDDPRIEALVSTTDGFKIAEKDLELRGLGDFIGTSQTGDDKAVMLMISNPEYYQSVKNEVIEILNNPKRKKKYLSIIDEHLSIFSL